MVLPLPLPLPLPLLNLLVEEEWTNPKSIRSSGGELLFVPYKSCSRQNNFWDEKMWAPQHWLLFFGCGLGC
jgi:hypothetical protein